MKNENIKNLTCRCKGRKTAFTPLVKAFRSGWDSLLCRWHSQARNPRIPSFANAHSSAFTLAEVLITLSIIGIVAAITIPSLVKNQTETANRSKLKKSMAAYEKAINQMLIDNGLETESAFKFWAKRDAQNGYTGERSYFNIAEESQNYSPCRFKTKDGIWWDICGTNDSNIEKTIVFFDKNYKDTPRTGDNGLEALAKINKDANGKKIFVFAFVGHRSPINGSVIVNDKSFEETQENNNENIQFTVKTIVFLNKEEDNESANQVDSNRTCSDDTKNDGGNFVSCKKIECQYEVEPGVCGHYITTKYDENAGYIQRLGCDEQGTNCVGGCYISENTECNDFGGNILDCPTEDEKVLQYRQICQNDF